MRNSTRKVIPSGMRAYLTSLDLVVVEGKEYRDFLRAGIIEDPHETCYRDPCYQCSHIRDLSQKVRDLKKQIENLKDLLRSAEEKRQQVLVALAKAGEVVSKWWIPRV